MRARDAKLLADLIERLNTLQKGSGDLKELEEREHQGVKYVRRVEKKQESFYYLKGPVLAFSSQERTLRQAIELDEKASVEEEPPVARQLRLLGVERRLAALWLNPRAFQAELQAKALSGKPEERAVLTHFLTYWKALEGVAISLTLDKDVALSLSVRPQQQPLQTNR